VYTLGDSRHTLCRVYGIKSEKAQVYLSKSEWSYLLDLASSSFDRQTLKSFRLQDELVEWRINCFEYKLFCANAIEFDTLYNELMYKPSFPLPLYCSTNVGFVSVNQSVFLNFSYANK